MQCNIAMSCPSLSPYFLQELDDYTESVKYPLEHTQRIKYTCFDISKSLLVFGASSGGIYVFNRQPCEFVQLIPSKDGNILRVAISPDERHIGFANGRGMVIVSEIVQSLGSVNSTVISKEHSGNEVTALIWNGNSTLLSGDDAGRVSVLQLQNFIAQTMFNSLVQTIMCLDSRICQLDVKDSMLLVSTFTRCYICDTLQEQYRQIGQKLRDGEFGACFVSKVKTKTDEHKQNNAQSFRETKEFNIVDNETGFALNESLNNIAIYCSRPSSRLWEASIDGTVERTHQFKQVLARKPIGIVSMKAYNEESYSVDTCPNEAETRSVNFPKIFSMNGAIFSFTKDALYFLNIQDVDHTVWCEYKDIVDCKVYKDMVFLWLYNGSLKCLQFMKLDRFLMKCYVDEKYLLCSTLCAFFSEFLLHSNLSPNLHVLSGIRNKLPDIDLVNIELVLERIEKLKPNDSTQTKSGIYVVDNTYQTQSSLEESNDKPKHNIDDKVFTTLTPEAIQAFKDLSLTVSDKFSTSKKKLKEKWGDFEEKMKHMGVEKPVAQELLLPKRVSEDEQTNLEYFPIDTDIIYRESSQEAIELDNNSLDGDKVCKSLYQYYRLSLVGKESEESNLISLIENNACDINQIYQLTLDLEQYCLKVGAREESKIAPKNIFLNYLNVSSKKDEHLNVIVNDDVLYQYFVNACISMNVKSQNLNDLGCECGFPLPLTRTNQIPEFSELIDSFIEKQWATQSRDQCYEVCKRMPYLWRKILYLRKNEDLHLILKLLLQMLDENLLHSFLPQFTIDTWEKAIQLYATLHANICLNCSKKFANFSVKDALSWDDLGALLVKSVGGKNAIKIMERNADVIDVGELTGRFYHTCLLVSLYEKYDSNLKYALTDTLYAAFNEEYARKEICTLLRTYSVLGDTKNTALPILVAICSNFWGLKNQKNGVGEDYQDSEKVEQSQLDLVRNLDAIKNDCPLCWLPLQNEVLIKDGGLWVFKCGHIFHGACLDLNKIKLCPSCTTSA